MVRRIIWRRLRRSNVPGLPHDVAVHVPFAGLVGGNAQFMITSTGAATQHIASGRLRPLTSPQALASSPEVPTMARLSRLRGGCGRRRSSRAGTKARDHALRDPKVRDQISAPRLRINAAARRILCHFVALDIGRYKVSPPTWAWPSIERDAAKHDFASTHGRASPLGLIALWLMAGPASPGRTQDNSTLVWTTALTRCRGLAGGRILEHLPQRQTLLLVHRGVDRQRALGAGRGGDIRDHPGRSLRILRPAGRRSRHQP